MSSLNPVNPSPIEILSDLSRRRERPVLLYANGPFSPETTSILHDGLRHQGLVERLDLVLQSGGGDPRTSRSLGVLLRSFTQHLCILVPEYAVSAATLLCLAADELILTPLSRLSPLDPQVLSEAAAPTPQAGQERRAGPRSISTEEVRVFREMARTWFGIGESTEENALLLQTLCQRIFPTTLTTIYRADQEMRANADELLRSHEPDPATRARICDQLISGFWSHSHAIHREEARELGLPVRDATPEEEECLSRFHAWSRSYLQSTIAEPEEPETLLKVAAVLAGPGFAFHYVTPVAKAGEEQPPANASRSSGWRPMVPTSFPNERGEPPCPSGK